MQSLDDTHEVALNIPLLMLSPLYLSEGRREWEDSCALGIKNDESTAL